MNEEVKNLIFFGRPHAGKSSMAKYLRLNDGYHDINLGRILRQEAKNKNSPHQEIIKDAINNGKIISDKISEELIRPEILMASSKSIIFDGYPRTLSSIQTFFEILRGSERIELSTYVVNFLISKEDSYTQALNRGRDDDQNPEILKKRISNYDNFDKPVIEELGRIYKVISLEYKDGFSKNYESIKSCVI